MVVVMETSEIRSNTDGATDTPSPSKLSRAQRAQIERNRQRALMLRQAREQRAQLRQRGEGGGKSSEERVLSVAGSQVIDTGGGFFIDAKQGSGSADRNGDSEEGLLLQPPAPLAPDCRPDCEECSTPIAVSFLLDNFSRAVCDTCRRAHADKYALIARTEAKREYILRDEDLDERPPPLPFLSRRNPHRSHTAGATMRLYLRLHVEERALLVWGSEGALEHAHEERDRKRDLVKRNKLSRQIRALRMEMRSSVYRRDVSRHEHTYGVERYNAADDTYSRTCTECSHVQTYEKM